MPEQYLPQSALPVGQTALGQIRPPQTQSYIPNPMDTTGFYRMQQGLQNNIGIMQQAEEFKLRKQALELANYEAQVKEMDSMIGMINQGFDDVYTTRKQSKAAADPNSAFADLNTQYAGHADVMNRNQTAIDKLQEDKFKVGQLYLSSGGKDPAQRLEAIKQISSLTNQQKRLLGNDKDYMEYATNEKYYDTMLDKIAELKATDGFIVNGEELDKFISKYEAYANETDPTKRLKYRPKPTDFDVSKYLINPETMSTAFNNDIKALATGMQGYEEIAASDGSLVGAQTETKRDLGSMTDALYNKWKNDQNMLGIYNNTIKGKVDDQGNPITMKSWIESMVKPYAPVEGMESTITDFTVINKADNSKSSTKNADGTVSTAMFSGTSESAQRGNAFVDELASLGYDPGGQKLKILEIGKNPDDYQVEEKDGKLQYFKIRKDKDGIMYNEDGTYMLVPDPYATFEQAKIPSPVLRKDSVIGDLNKYDQGEQSFNSQGINENLYTNDIKERFARAESGGRYDIIQGETPKGTGGGGTESAIGKYQYVWGQHSKGIKEVMSQMGIKPETITPEDRKRFDKNSRLAEYSDKELGYVKAFMNNPDAQEAYFDKQNVEYIQPEAQKLYAKDPTISEDVYEYMLHYMGSPDTVKEFLDTGELILYGKDHTDAAFGSLIAFGRRNGIDVKSMLQDHFKGTGRRQPARSSNSSDTTPSVSKGSNYVPNYLNK